MGKNMINARLFINAHEYNRLLQCDGGNNIISLLLDEAAACQ